MKSVTILALFGLLLSVPIASRAEWKLIETYKDLEIYYDTNSIRRFSGHTMVTTLTNYFTPKSSGKERYESMTANRSINCDREEITLYSLVQYSESHARGQEIFATPFDGKPTPIEKNTVANDLMNVICKIQI